uniref:putative immunity protein n=1 Tax=Methanoculleus sp. UBA331 TaxID=1915502 RepID=UPI00319E96CA
MKKYSKQDQVTMAAWAADCAERVLGLFEKAYPADDRPRNAIETCRTWVRTGVFRMSEIRGASLAAHAAARDAKENNAACFAARAAGQAVATAHVPQYAYGAAYYALKAVAAADPVHTGVNVAREREWQAGHLPEGLREEVMERIIVLNNIIFAHYSVGAVLPGNVSDLL